MITNHGQTAFGLFKALILAISVATVARAGMAYLPLTGPTSLRVLAVKPPKLAPVMAVAASKVTVASASDLNCTNSQPEVSTAVTNAFGTLPAVTIGAASPLDSSTGASIFALSTPDFLSITPEMLAAYFTPVLFCTNGVVIPAPFHVGFVPPLLQVQKSSHAEYIVK